MPGLSGASRLYSGRNYTFLRRAMPPPPQMEMDFSKGIIRDSPRTAIPSGGVYDSADFLLHQPGIAIKRGGTSYAGPALTGATYAASVTYAEFPAGSQIVSIGDNGHLYKVTAGATTDVSTMGTGFPPVDQPKLRIGGGKNLLVIPSSDGLNPPKTYDGTSVAVLGPNTTLNAGVPPTVLPTGTVTVASTTGFPTSGTIWIQGQAVVYTGTTATTFTGCTGGTGSFANGVVVSNVPPFKYVAIYKTRIVGALSNRLYFSPTPDPTVAWDTSNSWIDADYPVTGLAALHNALLLFSQGHTERIIGSTPPPGSDMDRAPVGSIGCTDARSIVVQEGNALFANPRGVYMSNGAGFASLTTEGFIESYWQSLLSGYDPATWVISCGVYRSFMFVSVLDNTGALKATLMCNVPRRAWWRLTNVRAAMMSPAVGAGEELYYADRSTNRVTTVSGMFSPAAGNKNDANGTAVTPLLETRAVGASRPGLKRFGYGRLSYDMRDAATDNPTIAVSTAPSVEASAFTAVTESPLAKTTDDLRATFTVAKDSQGETFRFQQANASSKTEIYGLEVEMRPYQVEYKGQ